jgi:hypothetical protein
MRSEYLFLPLTFVVVEARIETRIWKLETRASCFDTSIVTGTLFSNLNLQTIYIKNLNRFG